MRNNLCITAYTLNLLDLFCTLWALRHGAVELNPLMRSVPFMVCYKVGAVWGLLWWLSRQRDRAARYALFLAVALYGAVDLHHAVNIFRLWAR